MLPLLHAAAARCCRCSLPAQSPPHGVPPLVEDDIDAQLVVAEHVLPAHTLPLGSAAAGRSRVGHGLVTGWSRDGHRSRVGHGVVGHGSVTSRCVALLHIAQHRHDTPGHTNRPRTQIVEVLLCAVCCVLCAVLCATAAVCCVRQQHTIPVGVLCFLRQQRRAAQWLHTRHAQRERESG
jgi:hypothetical protein